MKNSVTRAEWPALSIAMATTVVIHLAVASGVIWGGWLDAGPGMDNPQSREMILNINLASKTATSSQTQNKQITQPAALPQTQPTPPTAQSPETDSGLRPVRFFKGDMADFQAQAAYHPTARPVNTGSSSRGQASFKPAVTPAFSSRPTAEGGSRPSQSAHRFNRLPGARPAPIKPKTFMAPNIVQQPHFPKPAKPQKEPEAATPLKPVLTAPYRLTGQTDYDTRFIQDVLKAWMEFKGRPQWAQPGKVIASFKLHHDGTITDLSFTSGGANQRQRYYCREALEGAAPFERWSTKLRNHIGADHRQCQFTFSYVSR